jgi:hypothetical protein
VKQAPTREELIAKYKRQDRLYKVTQAGFFAATLVTLGVILAITLNTLNQVKSQQGAQVALSEEIKRTAEEQDKVRQAQLDMLIRRLNCIVVFFQKTNRAELTIADIDKCTLNTQEPAQQSYEPIDVPAVALAPAPQQQAPMRQEQQSSSPPPGPEPKAPEQPKPEPSNPPADMPSLLDTCLPFIGLCLGLGL